ncbi:hypothetical protein NDR87_04340 [Nocardia sp. CDC159]|uniref:Uncharacterized protein n=1 Tax=Nocardia pulmonis TaxID=2951408 RepID=A0A9X2IW30_9NOCA|nr:MULTISPECIES: hypothetical protein [Nocardia]MCM6773109.1 hypothetical protein [Nocardia pulmonis]MCM6785588.1 hypothetical protein [Nocardia sp. CDC159]
MPPQRRKSVIGGAAAANPLADSAEHTPPVSPLRDAEWRRSGPALSVVPPVPDPAASVLTMPLPTAGDGPLSEREQDQLSACESSIGTLRLAFWAAGRALQIVRDGRLYRDAYATFDDYVEQRWDMQRSYAHKLIRAWPLAARLHPMAPGINEGQIRELLPVAAEHGEEAAVTVYATLAAGTPKVTAGKIREAISVLPEQFDKDQVVQRLQSWLRGEMREPAPERPIDLFSTVESRLVALSRRVVKSSNDDPDAAREFAAKLRDLAARIEQQLSA